MMSKSKKQRQQWWNRLTSEQQEEYINNRQARTAEKRKLNPPKELEFNPEYPWLTEGVNDKNRERWLAMIHKENTWLIWAMIIWFVFSGE